MDQMTDIRKQYLKMLGKPTIPVIVVPAGGITVHNVIGTSKEPKPNECDSFLDFWEKSVGVKVDKCLAVSRHVCKAGCRAEVDEIVGAHVRVDGLQCPLDEAWIVPLCKLCNNDDNFGPIRLPEGVALVPVIMNEEHFTATKALESLVRSIS